MSTSQERLETLDKAIELCISSLSRQREQRDELEVTIHNNSTRLRDLQEERRLLKAHTDRMRAIVRAVA